MAVSPSAFIHITFHRYSASYFFGGDNLTSTTDVKSSKQELSIAIFPFRDLGVTPQQKYLAVGIGEDILTEFSGLKNMLVVSHRANNATNNDAKAIDQFSEKTGTTHILSGSIRNIAGRVKINARLTETRSGTNLWAQSYNIANDEAVSIGHMIANDAMDTLPETVTGKRISRKKQPHFPTPRAYDFLLRGNEQLSRFSQQSLIASRDLYRRAIELDPNYARPMANLAFTYALEIAFGWVSEPEKSLAQAEVMISKSLQIDPATHQAYLARGLLLRSQRKYDKALASFKKAIDISPNSADAYSMIALTYVFAGKPDKALVAIESAIIRNPDSPFFYLYTKAMALFHLEQYSAALTSLNSALVKNSNFVPARLVLASTFAHLDRLEEANWEYQEVLIQIPDFSLLREQVRAPYFKVNDLRRYMSGLEIASAANQ